MPIPSSTGRAHLAAWGFLALLLLFAPGMPRASAAPPAGVVAEGWWTDMLNEAESSLGTRQAMLRFGAIGMALGLFIIWYRRP